MITNCINTCYEFVQKSCIVVGRWPPYVWRDVSLVAAGRESVAVRLTCLEQKG